MTEPMTDLICVVQGKHKWELCEKGEEEHMNQDVKYHIRSLPRPKPMAEPQWHSLYSGYI